jgi:hypothetical protein
MIKMIRKKELLVNEKDYSKVIIQPKTSKFKQNGPGSLEELRGL